MPEDDKKSAPGIGANSAIIVALFATGAYFYAQQAPLTVSRPPPMETRIEEKFQAQDVESRLWQDPFETVAREIKRRDSPGKGECDDAWAARKATEAAEIGKANEIREETGKRSAQENARAIRGKERRSGLTTNQDSAKKDAPKKEPLLPLHCRSPLIGENGGFLSELKKVRVIGVTAPGASYFEDAEARRRLRYAVLSGLQLERYEPRDALHIGYFRLEGHDKKGLPVAIPFEQFDYSEDLKQEDKDRSPSRILLLWIDEDVLGDTRKPLEKVMRLQGELCDPGKVSSCPPMQILGPYSSDVLRNLVTEMNGREDGDGGSASVPDSPQKKNGDQKEREPKGEAKPDNIRFYSFGATISNIDLFGGTIDDAELKARRRDDRIFRTSALDDALARAIGSELRRRGIYPGAIPPQKDSDKDCGNCLYDHHIALISDRDTLYGRTIVDAFTRELRCPDKAYDKYRSCLSTLPGGASPPGWIHRRAYLRGLDGMLPTTSRSGDKSSKKDNGDKDQGEASKAQQSSKTLERAFGQDQFDYLRRLAANLKNDDEELKRDGKGGIRAIGVLGNDVFDKLLVLRALKPLFPEAVFFTTDYDAALGGQDELEWSRNLIIASSYGPTAHKNYQKDIPPFRSTYQTAAFLAARMAAQGQNTGDASKLRELIEKGVASARLFEIDRRGGFLPLPTEKISASDKKTGADDIHPKIDGLYPALSKKSAASFAVVLLIVTIILLSFYRNGLLSPFLKSTWLGLSSLMLLSAIIVAWWSFVADLATEYGLGEPIAWAQGVSMWPSIALRVIAGVMAAVLIRDAWKELSANLEDIEKKRLNIGSGDGASKKTPASRDKEGQRASRRFRLFGEAFSYRLVEEEVERDKERDVYVDAVWKEYKAKEQLSPVAVRISFYVFLMAMLYIFLVLAYGWPNIPWRGGYGVIIYYGVTIPAVLALFILVFLVFDSTLLCLRFVEVLRRHKTHWPDNTRRKFVEKLRIDGPLLDDWIDLRFIACRTRCISKLIYYPFAIFALMIVSRSTAFAEFAVSPPIVIIQIVGFIALFGCAMALCFSAEKARATTKRRLMEGIVAAKAKSGDSQAKGAKEGERKDAEVSTGATAATLATAAPTRATADQLETLLKLVDELQEGSFVPLSQQPPIRALLLPLGGLGWAALLDYRLLPGL